MNSDSEDFKKLFILGDHFFWRRRRLMALPMIRERGIASIILENPFYGLRKPKYQVRSSLQQVSDLFVMGACLILESLVLFHWCERQGFWPLVSHGISMGGHMASLGATVWPKPIALVPCLSWTSASVTFTRGVMSGSIPWDQLEKQYSSISTYREELKQMLHSEANAFRAGVEFAQNYDSASQQTSPTPAGPDHQESGFKLLRRLNEEENGFKSDPSRLKGQSGKSFLESLQLPFFSSLNPSFSLSGLKKPESEGSSNPGKGRSSKPETNESPKPRMEDSLTFPFPGRIVNNGNRITSEETDSLRREAIQFFCGIMDECTHLKNFAVPFDPNLIVIVVAENDAYQPREGVAALPDIWPGAKLRFIHDNGHVASYLFKQNVFRNAIYEALDLLLQKYGHNVPG